MRANKMLKLVQKNIWNLSQFNKQILEKYFELFSKSFNVQQGHKPQSLLLLIRMDEKFFHL